MNEHSNALTGEFIDAVVRDQQRAAMLLADHPDLLNARWLWGETVLHFLAVEGFANGVRFLAEHGAGVNAVDSSGEPPLISVVVLGHVEIAEMLLHHGADPNARASATGEPAIHCAVQRARDQIAALLLRYGADPRSRTDLDESVVDLLPAYGPERDRMVAVLARFGIAADE